MKAVLMKIPLAEVADILAGSARVVNIPRGAKVCTMWTEADADYAFTQQVNPSLVLRIEHESYAEVPLRIPTVPLEIVRSVDRKPAASELAALYRKAGAR